MKFDFITFGSGTLDIFLKTDKFLIENKKRFQSGKSICFPFSSKVDLESVDFSSGGGGTNTAASLVLQGFKVAYCGSVGDDFAGGKVLEALEKLSVDTSLVQKTDKAPTNLSVIFSQKNERTCFVWRGASECLDWEKVNKKKLEAKWFYLAPLSGRLAPLSSKLMDFAHNKGMKVFANPGNSQIKMGLEKLDPLLKRSEVILLNQEEASLLTGVSYKKEKEVFKKMDELVDGLAIMTKGKEGVVASDGDYLWRADVLPAEVVEKTGAGDSFGAGFVGGFVEKENVEYALQKGVANSAACISKRGAKNGLLKKRDEWKRVKVGKKKL